jgi:peptidoglycan hydrolase CwlO-like protein
MFNSKIIKDFFVIAICLTIIVYIVHTIYDFNNKKDCISEDKLNQIRNQKNIEIEQKQKQIDSILLDLKLNKQKIDFLLSKVKDINSENSNLEKELERRKSEIRKMSNDEIINYWKNEFKK